MCLLGLLFPPPPACAGHVPITVASQQLEPQVSSRRVSLMSLILLWGLPRGLQASPGVAGALGIPAREEEEPFFRNSDSCPPETPQMLERRRNESGR